MTPLPLDDHALALDLARRAGHVLVELRARMAEAGAPPWRLMDEGDITAHRFLMTELAVARPGDAVLSEEGHDDPARLTAERVWIVDPLDGTREYGELGREDWAVHVALVQGGVPIAGAVSLPAQGLAFGTDPPAPPPASRTSGPPRMVTSRAHPPYAALVMAQGLQARMIPMGSAGAKAMAVVRGQADIYAHAGGQYEWDSAAPVAVAAAAGLHVSRIDGSPLVYNRVDPWMPDFLLCRSELAEDCLRALWG